MPVIIVLLLLPVSLVFAQERLDMWEEPSHQLVYQDEDVRILDVRIVPETTSEFHVHNKSTVYITIQDANLTVQYYGDAWSRPQNLKYREPGTVMEMASYVDKSFYHRVKNIDDVTFHLVAIVNLTDKKTDDELYGGYRDQLVENPWFKEHSIKLKAGQTSKLLSYDNDAVIVQYDDSKSYIMETGVAHSHKSKRAAWSLQQANTEFKLVNDGHSNSELIIFEIKR